MRYSAKLMNDDFKILQVWENREAESIQDAIQSCLRPQKGHMLGVWLHETDVFSSIPNVCPWSIRMNKGMSWKQEIVRFE